MNNKGFTLIELIGVILILALLAIIVFPNILSSISKNEKTLDEDNKKLIIANAKEYVGDNTNLFVKKSGNVYCIKVSTLSENGYTTNLKGLKNGDASLTTDAVKVTYNGQKFVYEYVTLSNCSGQTY